MEDDAPLHLAPKETEEQFAEKMEEIRLRERERLTERRAEEVSLPYINLKGFPIGPEVLGLIPKDQSKDAQAICFFRHGDEIRVGVVEPENPAVNSLLEGLAQQQRANVAPYLISEHSFEQAFKLYETIPKLKKIVTGVEVDQAELERFRKEIKSFSELARRLSHANLTQVITLLLAAAISSRASDLHIEAEEKDVKVRFRVDGVLHEVAQLAKLVWPKIINRIKLLAKLKLNVTTVPQDGRFTIYLGENEQIDVRTSILPTTFGESVVMRLLLSSAVTIKLDDLGLRGAVHELMRKELERPNGMILTTGPTGCGKTTTLYAFLKELNNPETKIITLENPIEYRVGGINQSQVDEARGYTFASGLRSILRQDPDVVMVGEIRDTETAEIAVNAALTGHLLLSTFHTNDAAGALPRLLAMQVKPFLLAPALNVIIAQRLVRRLCPHCKKPKKLDAELLARVRDALKSLPEGQRPVDLAQMTFYGSVGCEECAGIGYRGRIGIFEALKMNEEIEKVILSGQVSEFQIQEIAQRHSMVTMVQDGLLKAIDGITSVEEVFKVSE